MRSLWYDLLKTGFLNNTGGRFWLKIPVPASLSAKKIIEYLLFCLFTDTFDSLCAIIKPYKRGFLRITRLATAAP